jgi:transcription elongation factor GreA
MRKIPFTVAGYEQLKIELDQLKSKERPAIIAAIKEARAHGDLKENAEYHAAKERQSLIEGRINMLESMLSHAQVIDISKIPCTGRVIFGATVTLLNLNSDQETTYQIVGEHEADIKRSKVSITSPIARAIVGKQEGDVVTVQTPTGNIDYEIIAVKHA